MAGPRIVVLSLGGTIAMSHDAGAQGVVPTLTGEALIAAVPQLREMAQIQARSFRQLPSAHLSFADLEELAAEIARLVDDGAAGVVVTQGTDTIEETAFALDRLLGLQAPVVVTGAMRNPTLPGAEGPANLLAAVQVAASEAARGLGTLVVLNDEIHAARFVRKLHTGNLSAFASPQAGPLGWIAEGQVRIVLSIARVPAVPAAKTIGDAPVALLTLALGDDGTLVRAAAASGFRGIVVEAMGGGHASPGAATELAAAAAHMPVILASRTGAGEVLRRTYGFPGGEIDLQARGLIRAGWLDGLKARVLLCLLLGRGADRPTIVQHFQIWGGG